MANCTKSIFCFLVYGDISQKIKFKFSTFSKHQKKESFRHGRHDVHLFMKKLKIL